jgi:predicted outer membrane repeat protein
MIIDNSNFAYNSATLYGGALYFGEDHDNIHIVNTIVEVNNADSGAGQFYFIIFDIISTQIFIFHG